MVSRDQNSILIENSAGFGALADAIMPLLKDAERYRMMSIASSNLFVEQLNWKNTADKVTTILEGLVS
jgi:hypothetical protein